METRTNIKRKKITGTITWENEKQLQDIFDSQKQYGENLSSVLNACLDISLDDV